ncbi:MAG: diaminopimelate decarboxylase [Bowdeniella nasicola]|nr:diaminopimelate decarboxylase [Bowdeniella nasicola]
MTDAPAACPEPSDRPDIWPGGATRGTDGALAIGPIRLTHEALGDALGAPLAAGPVIVADRASIRGRAEVWQSAMAEAFWSGYGMAGAQVYYAGKAFLAAELVRDLTSVGLGIDTASLGELTLALRAGADPALVGLHGNAKTDAEIDLALRSGIGRLIIDSIPEIERIAARARELGVCAPLMVRVTTGVHAGGHSFIATAHEDQKFGLSLATGAAREAAERIAATEGVALVGLHSHIGSQIMDLAGFGAAARAVLGLRAELLRKGIEVPEVDLGGGYGVAYTGADAVAPTQKQVADFLAETVREVCTELATDIPRISIEPGRSVIAPAVLTLYRVMATKDVVTQEGTTRRYVAVDGGMSDNIRPVLYDAAYAVALANRAPSGDLISSRVVGKHCESGDILVREALLPADVGPGDELAIPVTGAYGRSMASNYNMAARPGVLALDGEAAHWWLRPETVDDVLSLDAGL